MTATSLPARIIYAILAIPAAGVAAFYASMALLARYAPQFGDSALSPEGYGIFSRSLAFGAVLAFTASLVALTLPWVRLRKRRGRNGRAIFSALFILLISLGFAADHHALVYDAAVAVWLAFTMTFTFVRYGVLDRVRRPRRTRRRISRRAYP